MNAQRVFTWLLVSIILWFLAGCAGAGNPPSSGPVEMESSWPADGSVGVDADIAPSVVFSVPMEQAATEAAFSVSPPTPGGFSWSSDGTRLTFLPALPLAHDAAYSCSVSGAARSADGVPIESAASFAFTTGLSEDTRAWSGDRDFYIHGAALTIDDDADGDPDDLAGSVSVPVSASRVPVGASLVQAFMYWGGTQAEGAGADQTVTLEFPDGTSAELTADEVFFDGAGSTSHDILVCKKDMTWDILSRMAGFTGTYRISGYNGLVEGGAADNASVALLFIFEVETTQPRAVSLNDTLSRMSNNTSALSFPGLDVSDPPSGKIAYYTLEGDIGGTGTEQVMVQGAYVLWDSVNPAGNPMNRTINTGDAMAIDTVGVDIDLYDISAALAEHENTLDVTYAAGADTWWHVLTVAGVETY